MTHEELKKHMEGRDRGIDAIKVDDFVKRMRDFETGTF
jgi:hypothetical protein